jgi:hypothetical protein
MCCCTLPPPPQYPRPEFVAADLSKVKLADALAATSFDPTKTTLFTAGEKSSSTPAEKQAEAPYPCMQGRCLDSQPTTSSLQVADIRQMRISMHASNHQQHVERS